MIKINSPMQIRTYPETSIVACFPSEDRKEQKSHDSPHAFRFNGHKHILDKLII